MKTVTVIDDEAHIRMFIAANLSVRGYTVFQAESGEEGLSLLLTTTPNVLILDMVLPGMNGIEVLGKMAEDERLSDVPVILMTASMNNGDLQNFPNLVQLLTKPASVDLLLEAVALATRSRTGLLPAIDGNDLPGDPTGKL